MLESTKAEDEVCIKDQRLVCDTLISTTADDLKLMLLRANNNSASVKTCVHLVLTVMQQKSVAWTLHCTHMLKDISRS